MFGSHLVSKIYHLLAAQTREEEHLSFSVHRKGVYAASGQPGLPNNGLEHHQWLKCHPGSNRSPGSSALTASS